MSRIAAAAAAGLVVGLVVAPGPAQAGALAPAADRPTPSASAGRADRPVSRLIVKTTGGGATTTAIRSAAASLAKVGSSTRVRRTATGADVLALSAAVPLDQAMAVARALTARADVVYAVPDRWVYPSDASPVSVTDPLFSQQWDLWDTTRPGGGYSSHAPVAWGNGVTGRADVVVAVIDTGITSHTDLVGQTVPGYDFVSPDVLLGGPPTNYTPGTYFYTANDGDGRDADPSDPGDWITLTEELGTNDDNAFFFQNGCLQSDSSWHGTHVTGTIVARQDNAAGISGIAPGVKVQPLRALGKCGGYNSDVNDAIVYAAGGTVPGIATPNPTPATVINLSLGGAGTCDTPTQDAINLARANGATVVVAAGNEHLSIASASPANCAGVVAVTATGPDGHLAGYSNVGEPGAPATIAAQGGDQVVADVLSTVNQGTTDPVSIGDPGYVATYASYAGTSMATPHVAAAAALLQSAAVTPLTPDQVSAELVASATPFPSGANGGAACTVVVCGAGILNIGAALAATPDAPATVTATPADAAVDLSWTAALDNGAPILGYHVEVSVDGTTWDVVTADTGTSATTLHVTSFGPSGADPIVTGIEYTFRVAARNAVGEGPATVSNPVTLAVATIPAAPVALSVVGGVELLTVDWTAPTSTGGSAVTGYVVRYKLASAPTWSCAIGTTAEPCVTAVAALSRTITTWPTAMTAGAYEVQVAAVNSIGIGPWSASGTATVTALAQSGTTSTSLIRPFVDGFQDTVRITATSNIDTTGNVQIFNSRGGRVATLPLASPGTMSVLWNGRINGLPTGARVPAGAYKVRVFLKGRGTGPTQVGADRALTVATSQAALPAIGLAYTTVYPYVDGYRDAVPVTVTTNVPATQIWKFTNRTGSITYRTLSFTRRGTATAAWNGKDSRGRVLPNGTYYLRVYVRGGEGTQVAAYKTITVSSKRVVPVTFQTEYRANAAFWLQGSPPAVAGSRSGSLRFGATAFAWFRAALPSSVKPVSGLRVATCSTVPATGGAEAVEGWVRSGSDPYGLLVAGTAYRPYSMAMGTPACYQTTYAAPAGAVFSNALHWFVSNDHPTTSSWQADTFLVTGTRYVLG